MAFRLNTTPSAQATVNTAKRLKSRSVMRRYGRSAGVRMKGGEASAEKQRGRPSLSEAFWLLAPDSWILNAWFSSVGGVPVLLGGELLVPLEVRVGQGAAEFVELLLVVHQLGAA